ncbi:hypothetical protein MRX96_035776 [Rhipicephalus microplus]
MKYRYLLERPLERTLKDHAWCLHETAVLSSTFFPTWVTKTLVAPDAIQDLGRMMEGLREAMIREPDTLPELNISASEATKWTVYVIGGSRYVHCLFYPIAAHTRTTVAQWFGCCAEERKVAGTIPAAYK